MCVRNLKEWVRDRLRAGINDAFGVSGEYHDGRNAADFSAGRVSCVGNTYFRNKSLYKYTRVAGGQERVVVISVIDCWVHILIGKW